MFFNLNKTDSSQQYGTVQRAALAATLALGGSLIAGAATAADVHTRVVGGQNVAITVAPSIVGLLDKPRQAAFQSNFQALFCGGTVVTTEWVLTAAHCLVDGDGNERDPSSLAVTMGGNELDGGNETIIDVIDVIVHESYVNTVAGDDIALLRLASVATVTPAVLEGGAIELNDDGVIAGWGALNSADDGPQSFPSILQGAGVKLIPGDFCGSRSDLFPNYVGRISDQQVCAGSPSGGVDTCQGDSGGPLYRRTEAGTAGTLVGITSWGIGCALATSPGVYTRVGAYVDWIQDSINNAVEPSTTPETPIGGDPIDPGTDPVDPGTDPVDPLPLAGSGGGSSGGGSSTLMLPLLMVFAVLRRFRRGALQTQGYRTAGRGIVAGLFTFSLLGCMSAQPLVAGDKSTGDQSMLSIQTLEQSLGGEFPTQVADVKSLWGSEADCSNQRTGVGLTRRAHFLDTCTFANLTNAEVCGTAPTEANYYFLDSKLVQVSLTYADASITTDVSACALQEAGDAGYVVVEQLGKDMPIRAADGRMMMASQDAATGLIVDASGLTLMQPELAPDVHVLQGMFAASAQ